MRIENGRGWARQLVTDAGGGCAREPHVGREQSEDLALGSTIAAILTTGDPGLGAQHVASQGLHRCGQMLLDLVHPEVLAGGR